MKKSVVIAVICFLWLSGSKLEAAKIRSEVQVVSPETYGRTLNLGLGLGYYRFIGSSIPVLLADFEFDIVDNFTLAPFIGYYSYEKSYYWGNSDYPFRNYNYRKTVIPAGVKGAYYFDQLFVLNPRWDVYLAASLGFTIRSINWEKGYPGDTAIDEGMEGLYLNFHVGAEYHFSSRTGLLMDISSGVSSLGLAMHF